MTMSSNASGRWRASGIRIVEPGSPKWKAYLHEHLELGTTFDPTFTIYSANRDLMKYRQAEWHDTYTLPSLFEFYRAQSAESRFLPLRLDDRGRGGVAELLPGVVPARERLQEAGGACDNRFRFGLCLSDLRSGLYQRARVASGSWLSPARGRAGGNDERRLDPARAHGDSRSSSVSCAKACSPDMVIVEGNPLENFKLLYGYWCDEAQRSHWARRACGRR